MTGCNSECGGQVWRTDVGMSHGVLNATPQVLEITTDEDGSTKVDIFVVCQGVLLLLTCR